MKGAPLARMKKTKDAREKLNLACETILKLSSDQLGEVHGGGSATKQALLWRKAISGGH